MVCFGWVNDMAESVPSMAGGGGQPSPIQAIRKHDKIIADLELVAKRLRENRQKLHDEGAGTYLAPGAFNALVDAIAADANTQDKLLAELFEEMCWHNPALLG